MTSQPALTGEIVVSAHGVAWPPATGEQLRALVDAWLKNRRLAGNTRAAYRWDVEVWLGWCELSAVDPLAAEFTHPNAFARWLESTPTASEIDDLPLVKRPAAPSTVARRLSAVSSWYTFLVRLRVVEVNPAVGADRPRLDPDHSNTAAFSVLEAKAMMAAAGKDPVLGDSCGPALMALLIHLGPRVSEACAAQLVDRGYDQAIPTITLRMKGGKVRVRRMPPDLVELVDAYLRLRAAAAGVRVEQLDGHLFVRPDGRPLDRRVVARFVRRVANAAGLPNANKISPHSCRHASSRIAKAQGVPLDRRQDALGHADPRTTRRYDRAEQRLSDDPSYLVSVAISQVSDLE